MKIEKTLQVAAVLPVRRAEGVATTESEVRDQVTLEASTNLARAVDEAIQAAGMTRSAEVEAIAAAVKNGTYKPDPQRIADRILETATLNARIRALLMG